MDLLELFDSIPVKARAEPGEKAVATPVENGPGNSVQYEKNEFNEKRSANDLIITAFRKSFPPGAESIPFNQKAMDAIKAGYAVRVWLGVATSGPGGFAAKLSARGCWSKARGSRFIHLANWR